MVVLIDQVGRFSAEISFLNARALKPYFGFIHAKLVAITKAYFDSKDFSNKEIIKVSWTIVMGASLYCSLIASCRSSMIVSPFHLLKEKNCTSIILVLERLWAYGSD